MIKINEEMKKTLMEFSEQKGIYLEGNILKVIDASDDPSFDEYIKLSIEKDNEKRLKRLEVTKQVQEQNAELTKSKSENEEVNKQLQDALTQAEKAKESALNDLELMQKRTQFELIGSIVKVALWIVCGVGVVTTAMFILTLSTGVDNKIVESAWSNMFGILLTNSFSIIGTIMGVKYASEKKQTKRCECKED